jgi:hypothetical protein
MVKVGLGRFRGRKGPRPVSCLVFMCLRRGISLGGGRLKVPLTKEELLELYRVSRPTWRQGIEKEIPLVADWDAWYQRASGRPSS